MQAFYAGMLAVAVALGLNNLIIRFGSWALIFAIPLVEELAKTLAAVWLEASLLGTHLVFGIFEAIYDILGPSRSGYLAGISSVATHLVFAFTTQVMWQLSGSLTLAISTAVLLHAAWNGLIAYWEEHLKTR